MRAKARTRIQSGLMCGKGTDTGEKVMNISRGFVLSPPGGGFEPKTFVSKSAKSTTRPRKPWNLW